MYSKDIEFALQCKSFSTGRTSFCTYPTFRECPSETQSDSRQKTWTEYTSETSSSVTRAAPRRASSGPTVFGASTLASTTSLLSFSSTMLYFSPPNSKRGRDRPIHRRHSRVAESTTLLNFQNSTRVSYPPNPLTLSSTPSYPESLGRLWVPGEEDVGGEEKAGGPRLMMQTVQSTDYSNKRFKTRTQKKKKKKNMNKQLACFPVECLSYFLKQVVRSCLFGFICLA
ncbi:hypothetical protein PUN28_017076 [Cardiocondyla obscurior]|uniref:Uncharacterized protein n=1 Tax=Cardiocondyla obscurior TaxID=286306 RepID=A0AAW2ELF5_9HYME